MKKILFLAPYPTQANIKDGMISRVAAIDSSFYDMQRIYLHVSAFKYFQKSVECHNNVQVFNLNIFMHFFSILKIIKGCDIIYSHSIWGCVYVWMLVLFLFRGKLVLDVHGVVPEEVHLYSRKFKFMYLYMNLIERLIMKRADLIICVTNAMKSHLQKKYKKLEANKMVIYNICPKSLEQIPVSNEMLITVKSDKELTILYSGGISPWQNIDMMLEAISQVSYKNVRYVLLVSNPGVVKEKVLKYKLMGVNIDILSVMPEELSAYYAVAHYAFILRDANVVNRVANPTKMIEYLKHGIIPIVLSPEIGDFEDYGYEYATLDDFVRGLLRPASPSFKNIDIANNIIQGNKGVNIRNVILQ